MIILEIYDPHHLIKSIKIKSKVHVVRGSGPLISGVLIFVKYECLWIC